MTRNIISGGSQRGFGSQRTQSTREKSTSTNRNFNREQKSLSTKSVHGNMKERVSQIPTQRSKSTKVRMRVFSSTFNSIFK